MTTVPQEHQSLIRRVLGGNFHELAMVRLRVDEEAEGTRVIVTVRERGTSSDIEGAGVGVVDAIFNALLGRYAAEYQSLKSIQLVGFSVEADINTKNGLAGVDAVGTVTIDVKNSEGRRFHFTDTSRSVTASIGRAVLAVVEFFANAERAFLVIFNARKDAVERGRQDLVSRYTAELAEVVECTSYAEVIENLKKTLA